LGLPVKPWSTSTPCGPPGADHGSHPAMTSGIRILSGIGMLPPVVGGGYPVGILDDAVDRAHRGEALAAPRAQLGEDDHVDPVVEDRAELWRAVPETGVAVDADRHVDPEGRRLPLRVALACVDALSTGPGRHGGRQPTDEARRLVLGAKHALTARVLH